MHRELAVEERIASRGDVVAVLDDAADLHVRKGKGLGDPPDAAELDHDLVEGPAIERCDRAVRPHRPRLDVIDVAEKGDMRDLDVAVFLSLFGKNLDAEILGPIRVAVVDELIPVQHDRGRAGREGDAGHGALLRRRIAELRRGGVVAAEGLGGNKERKQQQQRAAKAIEHVGTLIGWEVRT